MKVKGHEIPDAVLSAGIARMRSSGPFRAAEIEQAIVDAMPSPAAETLDSLAVRIVDRLLQREAKAGNIKLGGLPRRWSWVGKQITEAAGG